MDTGAALSFLGVEALSRVAQALLDKLKPCHSRVHGVSGEEVKVLGTLELPCWIAGKALLHTFVVADKVEPVLFDLIS